MSEHQNPPTDPAIQAGAALLVDTFSGNAANGIVRVLAAERGSGQEFVGRMAFCCSSAVARGLADLLNQLADYAEANFAATQLSKPKQDA